MPLVDVTYDATLTEPTRRRLGQVLPVIVAEAVECPEEPRVGPPMPGDIEIRFREKGSFDIGDLNCVIEVRTKFFASRATDKRDRAEKIRSGVVAAVPSVGKLGVWLILLEGSWAQT